MEATVQRENPLGILWKGILLLLLSFLFCGVQNTHAMIEDTGTTENSFTIDSNETATDSIVLEFATSAQQFLFNVVLGRFELSDSLRIDGNNSIIGSLFVALDHTLSDSDGMLNIGLNDGVWESLTWNDSSSQFVMSDDVNVEGNMFISGVYIMDGRDRKKILPTEFEPIGHHGGLGGLSENGGAYLLDYGNYAVAANMHIPYGYKATKVIVYGDAPSTISVYECFITGSSCVSKGTGVIDNILDITDIPSTDANYMSIIIDENTSRTVSENIYGGYVEVIPM